MDNNGSVPEMRDVFGHMLVELGAAYPNMIMLDADLNTSSKAVYFKKAYPARFIPVGIAEQNLFGIGANRFHPVSEHLCRICHTPCARSDHDLDLLPESERENPRFLRGHPHQPRGSFAQLHRGYCRDARAAEYARGGCGR
jgi:hypothetical protein